MIQLTVEEKKSYDEQEVCHICKKKFCPDVHDKNYQNKKRLKITVITQKNLEKLPIAIAI